MGRTNPTYRDALRAIEERWTEFRRALQRRDQPRFDRLFEYAREHADASELLNHQKRKGRDVFAGYSRYTRCKRPIRDRPGSASGT